MTFTDADLKRLKQELHEAGYVSQVNTRALLCRLDAAERALNATVRTRAELYLVWKEAAGK